jgi:hypothetical protein
MGYGGQHQPQQVYVQQRPGGGAGAGAGAGLGEYSDIFHV